MHAQNRTLTQEWTECIAECFRCAQTCEECGDDMIGMEQKGDAQLMQQCIRLCRECADICTMAGRWMSRLSPMADRLCRWCAEICDACAEECERHAPHHSGCGPCAEECRRCADGCRRMSGAAKAAQDPRTSRPVFLSEGRA